MCGIAGILTPNQAIRQSAVLSMLGSMAPRGPDGEGVKSVLTGTGSVCLGHRRLAIVDLSPTGEQPMSEVSSESWIVYNGEAYNAPQLRSELEALGTNFVGRSDTEVVLAAYIRWGTNAFDRIRGMFALAIWDARSSELVLARDPLGIKPLYVAKLKDGSVAFASELHAFTASGLLDFAVNRRALAGYLAYGSIQEPLTFVNGVEAFPRATWRSYTVDGAVRSEHKYWTYPQPNFDLLKVPRDKLVEEGRDLLRASIQRHLISDVPISVFLSAGLDSTAVLGFAAQTIGNVVEAFTVSIPGDVRDEGPLAFVTAKRLGVSFNECTMNAQALLDSALLWLDSHDQPSMDGVNVFIVAREVRRRGYTVALSGQGGDEVFGGYTSFRFIPRLAKRHTRFLPATLRRMIAMARARGGQFERERAGDIASAGPELLDIYHTSRMMFSRRELLDLGLDPVKLGLTSTFHAPNEDGADSIVVGDPVASIQRLEMRYYLGDQLLRDSDVYGMANSLEIRVPFLDRDLIDWALSIPGEVLLPKGAPSKPLLREIASDFFTDDLTARPKQGFKVGIAGALRGPLKPLLYSSVDALKKSGILPSDAIDRIVNEFTSRADDAGWPRIWALVTLGHFMARASIKRSDQ
jgi:asparagine synthase (glutamine-hydrolysing)